MDRGSGLEYCLLFNQINRRTTAKIFFRYTTTIIASTIQSLSSVFVATMSILVRPVRPFLQFCPYTQDYLGRLPLFRSVRAFSAACLPASGTMPRRELFVRQKRRMTFPNGSLYLGLSDARFQSEPRQTPCQGYTRYGQLFPPARCLV